MRRADIGIRDATRPLNIWDALGGILDAFGVLLGVLCVILGAAAAALLVWFVRRIVMRWRRSGSTQRTWPRARGVVDSVDAISGTAIRTASYRFVVDGAEITGRDDAAALPHAAAGMAVDIAYDPVDPRDNALASRIARRRWSWLVLAVIVAVLFGLCTYGLFALGIDILFVHH